MRVIGETTNGNFVVNVETDNEETAITTAKWHVTYFEHVPSCEIVCAKVIGE